MGHELAAQLLEVVSVIASRRQLKEPFTVPRPGGQRTREVAMMHPDDPRLRKPGEPVPADQNNVVRMDGYARAIDHMRATTRSATKARLEARRRALQETPDGGGGEE